MKRLLPLTAALVVLAIAAVVLTAMVGAGGGEPSRDAAKDTAAGDAGGGVAAMCVEGVPDCVDMIVNGGGPMGMCAEGATDCVDIMPLPVEGGDVVIGGGTAVGECELFPDLEGCGQPPVDAQPPITSGDGIDPNECSMVHNIDACEAGAFDVAIDFNEAVTQAGMDAAQEVLASFDPGVQLLILESFPPMGRASVRTAEPAFCEMVQAKLSDLVGVRSVTCEPATAPSDDMMPDEPVSSTP